MAEASKWPLIPEYYDTMIKFMMKHQMLGVSPYFFPTNPNLGLELATLPPFFSAIGEFLMPACHWTIGTLGLGGVQLLGSSS